MLHRQCFYNLSRKKYQAGRMRHIGGLGHFGLRMNVEVSVQKVLVSQEIYFYRHCSHQQEHSAFLVTNISKTYKYSTLILIFFLWFLTLYNIITPFLPSFFSVQTIPYILSCSILNPCSLFVTSCYYMHSYIQIYIPKYSLFVHIKLPVYIFSVLTIWNWITSVCVLFLLLSAFLHCL